MSTIVRNKISARRLTNGCVLRVVGGGAAKEQPASFVMPDTIVSFVQIAGAGLLLAVVLAGGFLLADYALAAFSIGKAHQSAVQDFLDNWRQPELL